MYGSLTFLPLSNFAVFDVWYFLQYCLQRAENCTMQIAQLNQLFQLLHLAHIYGHCFHSWFASDVTAAMLVYRTMVKEVFWEFGSIIMQNLSDILPLFCTPTCPPHHVSATQELGKSYANEQKCKQWRQQRFAYRIQVLLCKTEFVKKSALFHMIEKKNTIDSNACGLTYFYGSANSRATKGL